MIYLVNCVRCAQKSNCERDGLRIENTFFAAFLWKEFDPS